MSRILCNRDGLLLDGQPLYLLAGQLHYFRWPRAEWRDLLLKARAGGLNTIDTVIPWNLHEPEEGVFNFESYADLPGYLDLIGELGLHAIVRPAPYICAEWENGGFPAWLTARLGPGEDGLRLRTTDPDFFEPMLRWFDRLIPLLAERQIDRGGPVILVQVENEHWASGVYGHDAYQVQQAEALVERGITVPLYTCMGAGKDWPEFRNGWSGIAEKLVATRQVWPDNPMIVSELWSGWFDDWGKSRHNGKTPAALDWKLNELLAIGSAGFSHWMWGGGTHFAYWGGRTVGGDTVHMATTYDYDAPIGEYGGLNEKFYVARRHHLFLGTLGGQLSRMLADAANGGPRVLAPKAVPGRASGGSEPWRNVHQGQISATFLQNPTLDRQAHQVFLPAIDGAPAAHLTVEVEAGTLKPIFANLPLHSASPTPGYALRGASQLRDFVGDSGLTVRLHTSRLLGFWPAPAGDTLVIYGFEGEVGRLELLSGSSWTVLDPDGCSIDTLDQRLALRYWIADRPTVVRALAGDHPLTIVLLTQARAERWWPLGDDGFLCGPNLVTADVTAPDGQRIDAQGCLPFWRISANGQRFEAVPDDDARPQAAGPRPPSFGPWERLSVDERFAEDGWLPIARPQPLETLGCLLGYGWYRAVLDVSEPLATTLTAPWLSDRATVFVDGLQAGVLGVGPDGARATLPVHLPAGRHEIRLLADNLGRFNYGSNTGERKGLLDTLYWGGVQKDLSTGWVALWQEAVFAGEALANARPAHVRPDAENVDLGNFAFSGPSVWLLREFAVPAGRRAILTFTGDRNPGALFVNGQAVARFSRHYGGGMIKVDVTHLLQPGVNVVALNIQDYGGMPWQASLLHFDPARSLDAIWSFRAGITPGQTSSNKPGAAFWRQGFAYDPERHGIGPFKLALPGMGKGQLWLNGQNAGRYWQIGPQEFYKLPLSWFQTENELLLLDELGCEPEGVRLLAA